MGWPHRDVRWRAGNAGRLAPYNPTFASPESDGRLGNLFTAGELVCARCGHLGGKGFGFFQTGTARHSGYRLPAGLGRFAQDGWRSHELLARTITHPRIRRSPFIAPGRAVSPPSGLGRESRHPPPPPFMLPPKARSCRLGPRVATGQPGCLALRLACFRPRLPMGAGANRPVCPSSPAFLPG